MVDFASDPLRGFAAGMRLGDAMRTRSREDQQREAYGQAFQQGGFGAVGKVAGGMGDLETAGAAQGQVQEQEENALEQVRASGQVLQRIHQSLAGLPAEERAARLQQIGPGLEQYGVAPEMLQNVDTSDEGWAALGQELQMALGQTQRFAEMRNVPGTGWVGFNPDGSHEVLIAEEPPAITPYQQAQLDIQRGRAGGRPAAPPGYEWTPDGRQRAVEGGPADLRAGESAQRNRRFYETAIRNRNNVLTSIANARALSQRDGTTGLFGQVLSNVGGTPAHDLQSEVDTIIGNIGFEALQEMRQNSQTGGALGQVAVRELELLQTTIANLRTSQTREQFNRNLNRVETQYANTLHAYQSALQELQSSPTETAAAPQQEAPAQSQPSGGFDLENMTPEELQALRERVARGE